MATDNLKINVNKLNSHNKLCALVKITHPSMNFPLTIIDDNEKMIFEGLEYIPFPFKLKLTDQVEGQLPQANLVIPNTSSVVAKWIDSTLGGRGAKVEIIITRRNSGRRDYYATLDIDRVIINNESITFSLAVQNNLTKRAIRWTYDKFHAPALF